MIQAFLPVAPGSGVLILTGQTGMSVSLSEFLADFTFAVDHIFVGAELVEAHGAAGV